MRGTGRSHSNLRFSRQLAVVQILAVSAFALAIGLTTLWISRQHDQLDKEATRRMIEGGVAAMDEKLRTITLDYSLWTDAYESIRAGDAEWVWANIGTGTAENGTTDLMIVVEPAAAHWYGWTPGMGEAPDSGLLPAHLVNDMLRRLDAVPVGEKRAVSRFARVDGATWLLAAARITPHDGVPKGSTDADIPRHIFGFRISGERISEIGALFLVDDIEVIMTPEPGKSSLPLGSGAEGGYAVWTPGHPGMVILRRIALPLLLGIGLIALVSALLSRHVIASARRLERAVEAARAADRAKTEFLANISHELRTPMNGILGMAQLMRSMGLEPKLAKMVDVMLTSGQSQMRLIEDLLDLSRIDSGTRKIENAPFDPVAALYEVRDIVALKADAKGIALKVDAPARLGDCVLGDKGCFKQVLTNLIDNAVKFTSQGHVAVTLRCREQHDEMRVEVAVADTGPGIDPKFHKIIFKRFQQVDGTQTRDFGGVGLGLAITNALVELMGGSVSLKSEPGAGSCFTVELPFEVIAGTAREAAA